MGIKLSAMATTQPVSNCWYTRCAIIQGALSRWIIYAYLYLQWGSCCMWCYRGEWSRIHCRF
ncbi:hypothetical protein HBI56_038340 [Parastagonospora nodorum]|uniref:Uncharacterized protein n=1 Tax=Phaeosphaeria nodorum (strain SN15 / ATCC MYA-4574 / FGSC 10173) TaxID=321614 RepID=A0A7U2HWS5_PHANO|nr:hypothetical protein HBH56_068470 [Parastagonospora nodorum]QRC93508.1 hypothetical protein JI435_403970 [Parastagonospora nodorum SN15]KAH3932750.1 hypothetical protein HBH54_079660 [Parastagonospora nodorum]KAH3954817.1 hypothetical protein HBH53_014710 [Parastagonospora nodorum]KAH3986204.1 hypothetical protein HBH52_045870 [Parastagonospora nodorum]